MIITRHEAPSTKAALQDIAKSHGDSVVIISNTRLDGRNIVYFAADSVPAPVPTSAASETTAPVTRHKVRSTRSTSRKKVAAQVSSAPVPSAQATEQVASTTPLDAARLERMENQIRILQTLVSERLVQQHEQLQQVDKRLESMDVLAGRQKQVLDQVNRRLARQTELLMRQISVKPLVSETPVPGIASGGPHHESAATSMGQHGGLYCFLRNKGVLADTHAFRMGCHVILTDQSTCSGQQAAEFAALLQPSNTLPLRVLRFAKPAKETVGQSTHPGEFSEARTLQALLGNCHDSEGTLIFMPVREYLGWARESVSAVNGRLHGYFAAQNAAEQIDFLLGIHRLTLDSVSLTGINPQHKGLAELLDCAARDIPVLLAGSAKRPLSLLDAQAVNLFTSGRPRHWTTRVQALTQRLMWLVNPIKHVMGYGR